MLRSILLACKKWRIRTLNLALLNPSSQWRHFEDKKKNIPTENRFIHPSIGPGPCKKGGNPKNHLDPAKKRGLHVYSRGLRSANHHFWDPMILREDQFVYLSDFFGKRVARPKKLCANPLAGRLERLLDVFCLDFRSEFPRHSKKIENSSFGGRYHG